MKNTFIEAKNHFEETNKENLKLVEQVFNFFRQKFQEKPNLEWAMITCYEYDPNYPEVICKFKGIKDPYDIDFLDDDTQTWVDYLNNDLAGILQGYENVCVFSGKIKKNIFLN